MKDLIFVIFDDEGGGYNAVEGRYSLMVAAENKAVLKEEIRNAVLDYFGPDFTGSMILREFVDEVFEIKAT